jgi:DNA helicase-2/ATP-dependent DNA helicase PcrA
MFPESEQIILNLNYRSTPQILRACQNLIRHNEKQIQKALETGNPDGDDVIVLESSSEETEALTVVNEIRELVDKGFKHSDIAVLYRANFQSRYLEEAFQQHRSPITFTNGQCFYDRKEVKVLLDYLRVISNPNSDDGNDALVNIINVPNRYIGRKFIQELKDFSSRRGVHLYEGLKSMGIDLVYVRKNVREFVSIYGPFDR